MVRLPDMGLASLRGACGNGHTGFDEIFKTPFITTAEHSLVCGDESITQRRYLCFLNIHIATLIYKPTNPQPKSSTTPLKSPSRYAIIKAVALDSYPKAGMWKPAKTAKDRSLWRFPRAKYASMAKERNGKSWKF